MTDIPKNFSRVRGKQDLLSGSIREFFQLIHHLSLEGRVQMGVRFVQQ